MAAEYPNMLDIVRSLDPDGAPAAVVEILSQVNEMLPDIPWMEGNLPTGHRSTIRTGIPVPTFRTFYGAVQPTKSGYVQVTDNTAMMEDYSEVDVALANLGGNAAAFRALEDRAKIEGFAQKTQETVIYGNAALDPKTFNGLAPRFNSLSAENADNIIDCGGAGTDNASIWLIGWAQHTVFGIYPKGSQGGLSVRDLGEVTKQNADGSGGMYQIYLTHYRWDMGLVVKDWRYVVRACNIDRSLLKADASTGAFLPDVLFSMTQRVPTLSGANFRFYMDRDILEMLGKQLSKEVKGSTLTMDQVGGVAQFSYQGIPIRRCDKLAGDEARVV